MDPIIRKTEINLITLGTGVIIFGLWTLVKFLLTIVFADKNDIDSSGLFSFSAWLLTIIEFMIRSYIGFSARADGKGKRKTILYLIVTSIFILLYTPIIILELAVIFFFPEYIFNALIALMIDVTSMAFLLELMIDSIKLRRLRKQPVEASDALTIKQSLTQNGGQS